MGAGSSSMGAGSSGMRAGSSSMGAGSSRKGAGASSSIGDVATHSTKAACVLKKQPSSTNKKDPKGIKQYCLHGPCSL